MRVELERREDWRAWLEQNHASSDGVWLVTWKKAAGRPRIDYDAAVEEALCFGWVDSRSKGVDELRTSLYFTPRTPGSTWSDSNRARFAELEAAGSMTDAGRACYPVRTDDNGSSREISASRSSLRGFESCDLEPQAPIGVEHHMETSQAPSFLELGVSAAVEQALAARGILEPFRIQSLVLPDAMAGRDILAKAPTGSGKTLAFGLPLVELVTRQGVLPEALVLVPTRELALQVADEISTFSAANGIRVGLAYGGAPVGAQAKKLQGAHIVVATPGRLQDLIERRLVKLDGVRILVLDEADRMLDMGFRPQVERILRRIPEDRQTMLFSATLDGEVGELADRYTSDPSRFEARRQEQDDDGEIEHKFVPVTPDGKLDTLIELLEAEPGLTLVFVRTKRGADRLMDKLKRRGVPAVAMHGDMGQSQRERALERFRSGKATTLVATDVAARGLDLEAIEHVINFDPPEDDKGYVHRVGRTGRAGRSGRGSTLVLPDQQADVSRVATLAGHRETFESTGMRTARPKLVYTSRRGRRSRW